MVESELTSVITPGMKLPSMPTLRVTWGRMTPSSPTSSGGRFQVPSGHSWFRLMILLATDWEFEFGPTYRYQDESYAVYSCAVSTGSGGVANGLKVKMNVGTMYTQPDTYRLI